MSKAHVHGRASHQRQGLYERQWSARGRRATHLELIARYAPARGSTACFLATAALPLGGERATTAALSMVSDGPAPSAAAATGAGVAASIACASLPSLACSAAFFISMSFFILQATMGRSDGVARQQSSRETVPVIFLYGKSPQAIYTTTRTSAAKSELQKKRMPAAGFDPAATRLSISCSPVLS